MAVGKRRAGTSPLTWEKLCAALRASGLAVPEEDKRNCLPRPRAALMPEPQRREIACEDAMTIAARIAQLAGERAEAQIALSCAVMQGLGKADCGQCNEPARCCLVCAVHNNRPVPSCAWCYRGIGQASKPCPERG